MDTKANIPSFISGVYALVRVAQWNGMAGKTFTPYLVQADSAILLGLSYHMIFVQSTFSLLAGTQSSLRGATVIRPAFIPLRPCEKYVRVQNVLHYGIPNETSR